MQEIYSVGVDSIDTQHQTLLDILATFEKAIADHRPEPEIRKLVEQGLACVKAHFAHEEELGRASGYPGTDEHAFKHQHMTLHITSLINDALSGEKPDDVLAEHFALLLALLRDHIADEDRRLAQHIKAQAIKLAGNPD